MNDNTHLSAVELHAAAARLCRLPESVAVRERKPGAWSPKQILGHLIDSAINNHRRFVLGQIQGHLEFDGYDQEAWVRVQRYADADWPFLINLWLQCNLHMVHVVLGIPEAVLDAAHTRHSFDRIAWKQLAPAERATLARLFDDYGGHLRHHLAQIWECESRQEPSAR